MNHSLRIVGSACAVFALLACGGAPPPKTADDATTSAAAATTPDMPPPPTTPGAGPSSTTPAAGSTPAAPAPSTATSALRVVALKLVVPPKDAKKLGFTTLEVKDDGAVLVDGKSGGKIAGDGLKDDAGNALVSVSQDGAVSGEGVKSGKFSPSDELVMDGGAKIQVTDDGAVMVTDDKGKGDVLGAKFDGVSAWAKREAALIIAGFVVAKRPALGASGGKAAATTKGASKK